MSADYEEINDPINHMVPKAHGRIIRWTRLTPGQLQMLELKRKRERARERAWQSIRDRQFERERGIAQKNAEQ